MLNPVNRCVSKKGGCRKDWFRLPLLLFLTTLLLLGTSDIVAAGWDQYTQSGEGPGLQGLQRITASSDRDYYDWGYKQIQISMRRENFLVHDCGWWYVIEAPPSPFPEPWFSGGGQGTLSFKLIDAAGDTVLSTYASTTKGQTGEQSYAWEWDDDPGQWTVTSVSPLCSISGLGHMCYNLTFYLYVRGQLDVTQITASPSPTTGSPVTINATLRDNAGNLVANNAQDNTGNSTRPAVMAIVTGPGEYFEINLYDDATNDDVVANDGIWSGQFTPQETGDYRIIVKAGDGHDKWVDGAGSKNIAVTGTFPYAFASGASILTVIFMILLALKSLMHLGNGQRVK